jgi:type II secretory pathway predicted ATPase ExeA
VGYFETEFHKSIGIEIRSSIKYGRLIAVTGIVGCGKTTTLKRIQEDLKDDKAIIVSKSLSIDKARVNIGTLMMALFYDLSSEKEFIVPTQPEKRERKLQELIKKVKKPVALFIDEAHDLHGKTLIGLKRLIELVQDCGGILSVVLAGHPKLKNDLRRATLEEIGARATIFDLEGITANKREYIEWLVNKCIKFGSNISTILSDEAIDLLSEKLLTPLQIEHYLTLAFEEGYHIGVKPITTEVVESVLAVDLDDLEPKLTRHGYNIKTLADIISVPPKTVRDFVRGKLPPGKSQEVHSQLLAAGVPL